MYKTEPLKTTPPIINQSVTVPPLKDERSNENSNYALIYMVPLMPFGWQDFSTPEGIQMHCNSGFWFFKP
jgi:hypothetical protein